MLKAQRLSNLFFLIHHPLTIHVIKNSNYFTTTRFSSNSNNIFFLGCYFPSLYRIEEKKGVDVVLGKDSPKLIASKHQSLQNTHASVLCKDNNILMSVENLLFTQTFKDSKEKQ